MLSSHLYLGLPCDLLVRVFQLNIFLTVPVDGFGGLVVSMLASGTQVCGDFYGRKNAQHAFLRSGSKRICPMSQLCGMSKNLVIYMNYGLLAKFQV